MLPNFSENYPQPQTFFFNKNVQNPFIIKKYKYIFLHKTPAHLYNQKELKIYVVRKKYNLIENKTLDRLNELQRFLPETVQNGF